MRILITGAGGMIGAKLVRRLAGAGKLSGQAITALDLVDLAAPQAPEHFAGEVTTAGEDLSAPGAADTWTRKKPDVIFHLAAVVSGEAEADFEKGYRVNLDGARQIFDAVVREHKKSGGQYSPRVVFTSSIAAFGSPLPDVIEDDFLTAPLGSYGAQKVMCEVMINDYSRKGFFDGVSLRLPNICVRPGKPNAAASGFFSNIIREPLAGKEAVLPVEGSVRAWHASPRSAVGFLVTAAEAELSSLGGRRALNLPGVSATVAEQIEALRKIAGEKAVALIKAEPDENIARLVHSWPKAFNPVRALALGFTAETNFEDIIRAHIEDEMGAESGAGSCSRRSNGAPSSSIIMAIASSMADMRT